MSPPLSLVIPAYNEAGAIADVAAEALEVLGGQYDIDIVVVDDASEDGTAEALAPILAQDSRIRIIRHPRRSGKSAALRTGMLAARHVWAATMDGDGQNDPRDISALAAGLDLTRVDGIGLAGGVRRTRHDGASRKLASRLANGLRRQLLNDDCPDTGCGLKLLPREVFLAFPYFDAMHRYLPAFARHLGYETRYETVNDRPRTAGQSKYSNIGRAIAGLFDLMGVMWLMRRGSVPARALLFRDRHDV